MTAEQNSFHRWSGSPTICYDTNAIWEISVENYFAKIKEFRGIATRYDKTDTSYAANLNLAATIIAMR
jgi:transposase